MKAATWTDAVGKAKIAAFLAKDNIGKRPRDQQKPSDVPASAILRFCEGEMTVAAKGDVVNSDPIAVDAATVETFPWEREVIIGVNPALVAPFAKSGERITLTVTAQNQPIAVSAGEITGLVMPTIIRNG